MKPKIGDTFFIQHCSLIGKDNFLTEIEQLYFHENIILAKALEGLWFDISQFEFDENKNFWRDILPNNQERNVVKYNANS